MKLTKAEIKRIKPYGSNVVLRLSKRVEQSSGGIVFPTNVKVGAWHSGTIVAVGTGRRNTETGQRIPSVLRIGQKAVFQAFSDKWEMLECDDGEKYMIMPEEHLDFCMADGEGV